MGNDGVLVKEEGRKMGMSVARRKRSRTRNGRVVEEIRAIREPVEAVVQYERCV